MIFEAKEIKTTSLNYRKNLLKNREPKDEFVSDLKVINILHENRMNEECLDEEVLSTDDFISLLKNLKKKNKSKYKFILNAGNSFHNCLIRLFEMTWK